jgi:hypothetical protein
LAIAVRSLPYNGESLRLEQCRGRLSERLVVVDDENRRAHAPIVAEAVRQRIGAGRNPEQRGFRASTDRRLWMTPFRRSVAPNSFG